jgi:hypothetical protein
VNRIEEALVRPWWIDEDDWDSHAGYRGKLICAGCGEGYTHTLSVEIFMRSEDREAGLRVEVVGESAVIDTRVPDRDNPSSRREGIRITFGCEQCNVITVLEIAQHKGCTRIYQGPAPSVP